MLEVYLVAMIWILSVIVLMYLPNNIFNQQQSSNFGPYRYEFLKYETCKGPKRGECGSVRIDNIRNTSNIPFILDFPQDCSVTKAKVTIGTVQKNNKTKIMWNYQLNHPCDHFVLGPLLNRLLNMTHNCTIKQGHYEVGINMDELSNKFLGSHFFYDTYFFKTIAHNNVNNFFCISSIMRLYKL